MIMVKPRLKAEIVVKRGLKLRTEGKTKAIEHRTSNKPAILICIGSRPINPFIPLSRSLTFGSNNLLAPTNKNNKASSDFKIQMVTNILQCD